MVRLSGAESAVRAAREKLGGDAIADPDGWWASVREQTHAFFTGAAQLWRLSVKSTAPVDDLGGEQLMEWGGSLRWLKGPAASAAAIRDWSARHGGHATLFRGGDKSAGVFHPLAPPLLAIHKRLKETFDPAGILNPGRMYQDFKAQFHIETQRTQSTQRTMVSTSPFSVFSVSLC